MRTRLHNTTPEPEPVKPEPTDEELMEDFLSTNQYQNKDGSEYTDIGEITEEDE